MMLPYTVNVLMSLNCTPKMLKMIIIWIFCQNTKKFKRISVPLHTFAKCFPKIKLSLNTALLGNPIHWFSACCLWDLGESKHETIKEGCTGRNVLSVYSKALTWRLLNNLQHSTLNLWCRRSPLPHSSYLTIQKVLGAIGWGSRRQQEQQPKKAGL